MHGLIPLPVAVLEDQIERTGDLVKKARNMIAQEWNVKLPAPESMIGTLSTIPIPSDINEHDPIAIKLHDRLRDEFHCELPVIFFDGKVYIRISAQIYNEFSEYEHLAKSVLTIL